MAADSDEPVQAHVDSTVQRVDIACDAFEAAWQSEPRPRIEDFLDDSTDRERMFRELLALEFDLLQQKGEDGDPEDYRRRFPDLIPIIDELFTEGETLAPVAGRLTDTVPMSNADQQAQRQSSGTAFADYELLEEIARGGMGVVYRAVQTSVNRVVALKMILSGQLASDEEVRRFHSEAEAAALLDHPNIVPVFDVGEHDGRHYFSMAYVEGDSLSDRLREGPLPPLEAARFVRQITDAVACAHDNGVIHRDLKPSNVLIDRNGSPRVTDFGLARQLESDSHLTATGQVMGTPSYMPPEQAAGNTSQIDVRSDVYSLGAILYSLVTGRPPFQAAHIVETLRQVIDDQPVEPRALNPEVDRDLETICLKCLAKEPSHRYQRAVELSEELDRYLAGKPIVARSITRRERLWRWCRRNRLMAAMITTAALSLLLGTGISIYFAVLAQRRAEHAERGTQVALTSLRSVIDTVQHQLRYIPAAQQIRRNLLREAMTSLQQVSGQVQTQSQVDHQTAKALVDLARLAVELGDEEGMNSSAMAESNFRASVEMFRQIVPEDCQDQELLRDKAWAISEYGNFYLDREEERRSEELLKEALALRQQINTQFPGDVRDEFALAVSLSDWGDQLAAKRQYMDSIPYQEQGMELAIECLEKEPENSAIRQRIMACREKIGDAWHDMGKHGVALPYFEKNLSELQRLLEKEPDSPYLVDALSYSYERLGNHYLKTHEPQTALEMYDQMRQTTLRAMELDPESRVVREGLAYAHEKMAQARRALGQHDEATADQDKASSIRRELGVR